MSNEQDPKEIERSWKEPTLDEIGRAQGVTSPQDLDGLIGAGKHLWESDREFEQFVGDIYKRRREQTYK